MSGPAFLGIWSLTMAAMMLPSELPLLRLDHATSRSALRTLVLGSGYLAVWLALGGVLVLARVVPVRPPVAAVLGAAAPYQATPLKRRCIGLTAALLALGMMSVGWMVVAGVAILVEKTTRVVVVASRGAAAALALGAVLWAI